MAKGHVSSSPAFVGFVIVLMVLHLGDTRCTGSFLEAVGLDYFTHYCSCCE
ncbi:hypothetical protein MKX01_001384 [Papaver californicum]|nr:hypothetical protein MKX01_001384 [Papaver californicum]